MEAASAERRYSPPAMSSLVSLVLEGVRRAVDQFLGADPDAMRHAAHELETQAEHLSRQTAVMSSELHQAWWQGPDADRFRTDWEQVHQRESRRIVGELHQLAAILRQEAARQERASAE